MFKPLNKMDVTGYKEPIFDVIDMLDRIDTGLPVYNGDSVTDIYDEIKPELEPLPVERSKRGGGRKAVGHFSQLQKDVLRGWRDGLPFADIAHDLKQDTQKVMNSFYSAKRKICRSRDMYEEWLKANGAWEMVLEWFKPIYCTVCGNLVEGRRRPTRNITFACTKECKRELGRRWAREKRAEKRADWREEVEEMDRHCA